MACKEWVKAKPSGALKWGARIEKKNRVRVGSYIDKLLHSMVPDVFTDLSCIHVAQARVITFAST